MAGYTRQSAADIIASAVIKAAPVNAEFNEVRDAFAQATGHAHDGTTAEGAYVPLISDTSAYNKVVVDSVNNRISSYVDVASVAVEQFRAEDGVIYPVTTNDIDLGTGSLQFKDAYFDGTVRADTLLIDESATVTANLTVSGNTTLGDAATDTVTITADVASNLIPSADSTYTLGDASNYWSTAHIDTITTTGNVTVGGALSVTGSADFTNTTLDNVTDPSTAQQAATKNYVDVADALKLNLTGGTMSGAIAMGTSKITGLGTPTASTDAATKAYVDTSVSDIIDAAPAALDTLNELAAALGDDPNFATTVTNSIATKLPLAGGSMSGDITMGTSIVTSTTTPATDDTLTRKGYVDTQDALKLDLAGGTLSGNLALGGFLINGAALTPTTASELTSKSYVDSILGSATAASDSAAAAATSETNAAASYDSFDDRYLGAKGSEPTVDNDGNSLITGAIYWNTGTNQLYVWDGAAWDQGAFNTENAVTSFNTREGAITLTEADVITAGALVDSELTNIAAVKALDQGVATTDSPTFVNITATSISGDGSALTSLPVSVYADGTAAAPSITFTNDTDTGLYLSGTNSIGISTAGTEAVTFNGSGASTAMQVLSNDGLTTLLNIDETTDDLLQVINSSDAVLFEVSNTTGVAITANTAITGTFGVTGVTTLTGALGVTGATTVTGALTVSGDTLIVTTAKTPATAAATGTAGQIAWDTGYIYICTATDTWKRVAIATW